MLEEGGIRGTRLYFLLLVWGVSASISLRKELSSCSASSSRESGFAAAGESGFEGVTVVCVVDWGIVGGVFCPEEDANDVGHSQPIMKAVVEVVVDSQVRLKVLNVRGEAHLQGQGRKLGLGKEAFSLMTSSWIPASGPT